jgi:hypothetical protein
MVFKFSTTKKAAPITGTAFNNIVYMVFKFSTTKKAAPITGTAFNNIG